MFHYAPAVALLAFYLFSPVTLRAQPVSVSGSLRTRGEFWDWFTAPAADNDYAFMGSILRLSLKQERTTFDWQMEFAAPVLLGLPDNAIAPGAQGQLGLGPSYFVANRRNTNAGMVFVKQGFVRLKDFAGHEGHSLKIGRMEFIDGAEVIPKNATLSALKRDRIAHRLLGNFAFSHVQRSFDGFAYALDNPKLNLTLLAARPTRGVFQVDGWGELKVNVFYGALTAQVGGGKSAGEWRVFGLGYNDYRDGVLKTDNRAAALRAADTGHINIGSYGAHYLHALETQSGTFDLLLWGVLQTGSWGTLSHRAGAFATEGGWQPPVLKPVKPWLRGGYNYASGDGNPADGSHGTFFQVLPTPRIYARFPFFNMMNSRDAFGEVVLRPPGTTIRADVHSLSLASSSDLWYLGGGAFQPWTFGYTGRPSNGGTSLATLYDVSIDYQTSPHISIGGYYGHAVGNDVPLSIYPAGKDANLGYIELTIRF